MSKRPEYELPQGIRDNESPVQVDTQIFGAFWHLQESEIDYAEVGKPKYFSRNAGNHIVLLGMKSAQVIENSEITMDMPIH